MCCFLNKKSWHDILLTPTHVSSIIWMALYTLSFCWWCCCSCFCCWVHFLITTSAIILVGCPLSKKNDFKIYCLFFAIVNDFICRMHEGKMGWVFVWVSNITIIFKDGEHALTLNSMKEILNVDHTCTKGKKEKANHQLSLMKQTNMLAVLVVFL